MPSTAVILAAGQSSRFEPFRRNQHKSTFQLFGKPIISQTIEALGGLGIKRIIVIKSPSDKVLGKILEPVKRKFTVEILDQKEPLGMGNAILTARKSFRKTAVLVINPQQVNIPDHIESLDKMKDSKNKDNVILFSQKTNTPQKYGMLGLKGNTVTKVVEKPTNLTGLSDKRILGIYILSEDFINFMSKLPTSEYQLEKALNKYAKTGKVTAVSSRHPTLSLKYPWDLFPIVHYQFEQFPDKTSIHPKATIHPTAQIDGKVIIKKGAKIYPFAIIQGPAFIGENVVIGSYCKVRGETVLEERVELQNQVDAKHSIICRDTHIHSGFVGDSIIGENVGIGANFITANRRLDRKKIRVMVKGKLAQTDSSYFGALIGDNVKVGIQCGSNPGVVVPEGTSIMPGTMITNQTSSQDK